MSDPAPLPASEVLASPPDLPTPTPGAAPLPASADSPATPPAASPVDPSPPTAPEGWDPAVHENPPRRNAQGGWARLRGNAARKAKGLPMIGALSGVAAKPASSAPAAPLAAPSSAPPASPSVLVLPTAPPSSSTPGAAGAEVAGEPSPAQAGLGLDAYDGTAAAITGGQFGILSILLGKAWNASPQESQAWRDAWRRVFHHYQWRPLGPLVELIMLAVTSTAKRRDDPETRQAVGGMFAWFRRASGRATVADVATAPAPVEPAPPAPAAPARHPLAGGW